MWQYWSIRELQDEIGDANLQFLETVIGALNPEEGATFLGAKSKLAKLVESLKDHTFFRKQENIERCLHKLPPDVLQRFITEAGLDPVAGVDDEQLIAKAIRSGRQTYEAMVRFFELDERFLATEAPPLPATFNNIAATPLSPKEVTKPFKTLKPYQVRCVQESERFLSIPWGRMLLQMPTGSGKTRTAMELISEHLNSLESAQVVWLANTRELCEQAVQCFVEVWDHVGKADCQINRMWGDNSKKIADWSKESKVFTVASLQAAWRLCDKQGDYFSNLFSHTTLVIIDEAHIAVAPTYRLVLDQISWSSNCRILGLTATPGRIDDEETAALSLMFNQSIVMLQDPNPDRDNAIAFLRQEKIMSAASYTPLRNDSFINITAKEKTDLEMGKDFSDRILGALGSDALRSVLLIVEVIHRLKQDKKIILFAPSVESSFLISAVLTFLGYKSTHVSGKTAPKTRDLLIKQFMDGDYQILCNFGVLSTGFDAPKIDTVVIARPTKSPVLYSQMIGRGMRGPGVGGTDTCEIVELIDNYLGQGDQDFLYKQFQEYWAS